jgi:glycerol kinase
VPAFAGLERAALGSICAGTISGLTRDDGAFVRAALDGIAFQVADVLDVMQKDSGIRIEECAWMVGRRRIIC